MRWLTAEGQGIEAERVLRFKSRKDTVKTVDSGMRNVLWSDCWATKAGGRASSFFPLQSPDSSANAKYNYGVHDSSNCDWIDVDCYLIVYL